MNETTSHRQPAGKRVLIVGMGNELRGDDGFGLAVVRALADGKKLPAGVHTTELGIGGIGLVHELMDGYDALVLVDAVDRDGAPGALYVLEPEVPEANTLSPLERREVAADMHQAVPGRALIMAHAAGVLPPVLRMIGCQPAETEEFSTELSPLLQQALPQAVEAIRSFLLTLDANNADA